MEKIPGYKLLEKIGKGGMAEVYKGVQLSLQRPVAVKLLLQNLADHSEAIERFNRESLIIARLVNPHIIHVIDRGITAGGQPYFIMEFVEGTDLAVLIRQGKLNFNQKLNLCLQMCRAFAYAHKNGVIHRDIKPSNVLIDRDGNVRVLDFGIAQFYGDKDMDSTRTRFGTVMGTIPYMSPEQQNSADEVTALSDLYSFGVLMYELFTGVKPVGRFQLPSEIHPKFPLVLENLIMRCMEVEPKRRFGSFDEVRDLLLKMMQGAHLGQTQRQRASQTIARLEDRFTLLDIIKEDGYATVYLFENRQDRELLVIKKCASDATGFTEAKKLTLLKHDNIINILGTSGNAQNFIIVMEYLSGGSLKDRLVKPLAPDAFLRIARQISAGLAFAHRNRIIHGNLRPSNIMFDPGGRVKLADFGLNEHYPPEREATNWYNPGQAAPSVRGDIFAAGVIFYQMLTGTLPNWRGRDLNLPMGFKSLPLRLQKLLTWMLAGQRGPKDGNFDQILDGLDVMLRNLEQSRRTQPPGATAGAKSASHAEIWRFAFLLLLLLATALVASWNFSENLALLTSFIRQIWQNVLRLLGG